MKMGSFFYYKVDKIVLPTFKYLVIIKTCDFFVEMNVWT